MEDRALLELAAKAAGMKTRPFATNIVTLWHERGERDMVAWNPITDDGDALRLAVVRRVDVVYLGAATVQARAGDGPIATEYVNTGGDHADATRRAIVRAVAALATAPAA